MKLAVITFAGRYSYAEGRTRDAAAHQAVMDFYHGEVDYLNLDDVAILNAYIYDLELGAEYHIKQRGVYYLGTKQLIPIEQVVACRIDEHLEKELRDNAPETSTDDHPIEDYWRVTRAKWPAAMVAVGVVLAIGLAIAVVEFGASFIYPQ